ncbi:RHE_PE00001 family protein [Rhizobium aegyptiacum]|uniref:RHE_PE00001 family protein n=1 Tax=Rhizobium aegyptiacum TaxID=1764550 RepID=UPI0007E5A1F7|nr:RHE_PE00001 family protein [Rhizobium aegyptiacum]
MTYEIGDLPLATLLPAIGRAEDQLARLDEIVRRSPVGPGFAERAHFHEAAASMWISGELVHVEDLVLHDANRDVRAPTHEITIAQSILRTRRRVASAEPDWAKGKAGIEALVGRSSFSAERNEPGEGTPTSVADLPLDEEKDAFAAELAEIDALLNRSARVIEAGGKEQRHKADPLVFGELVIRDSDWDEGGRISDWTAVMRLSDDLPASLGAALLWDAWESLEPLQRQHWLGPQLVNSYLRSRGKVSSHLFGLNLGLKAVPRERRRSRNRVVRLLAAFDAMTLGAELAMKEIIRLGQVRDRLERKLQGKRSSSSLPAVVELLIARPIVSSSMIIKELKVSHRAALNLVAELGVREVTGRGSFRAWGII